MTLSADQASRHTVVDSKRILLRDDPRDLVTPIFHIQRKDAGSKLHLSVRVPGADTNTSVRIMLGNRTIAQGTTTAAGLFVETIASPIDKGNLRAVATVLGADKAISKAIPFTLVS